MRMIVQGPTASPVLVCIFRKVEIMAKDLGVCNNQFQEFRIDQNGFIHFLKFLSVPKIIEKFFITLRKCVNVFSSPIIGR